MGRYDMTKPFGASIGQKIVQTISDSGRDIAMKEPCPVYEILGMLSEERDIKEYPTTLPLYINTITVNITSKKLTSFTLNRSASATVAYERLRKRTLPPRYDRHHPPTIITGQSSTQNHLPTPHSQASQSRATQTKAPP
jgi:hypothetical protein